MLTIRISPAGGAAMNFGDVVFEGGKDVLSGAIQLAQYFLPGKDRRITHAMVVLGQGIALDADPDHGVHFRTFKQGDDLKNVLYVMRPNALQVTDEEVQQQIYKAGAMRSWHSSARITPSSRSSSTSSTLGSRPRCRRRSERRSARLWSNAS
jgi:hypothetical protein